MAESKITKDQIVKIAQLSNLNLTEEEIAKFSKIFTDTLDYINVLEELDTKKVSETFQVTGLTNVFMHGNENKQTLDQEKALENASDVVKNMFSTKAVFNR